MAYTKGLNHWADILVVVLYFVSVLGVGLWVSIYFRNYFFITDRPVII